MAINGKACANALKTLLAGLSGIDHAQVGIPDKIEKRMNAFVSMAGQISAPHATQVRRNEKRILIALVYRTDLDSESAELALFDIVDAFMAAIYADLTLGGVCSSMELDLGLADDPDYFLRWGMQFREYYIIVTCKQYGSFSAA